MIQLLYDTATQTAKLAAPAVIKAGVDVRVRITFSSAPGEVSAIQITLGSDAAPPAVLAFTDGFEAENATTWIAVLDANDTRLVTFMAGKNGAVVKAELITLIDGLREATQNLDVSVQPLIASGPVSTEGGPTYYTQAQVDALLAEIAFSGAAFAALNLSALPTSNPGGGKPWLNGGVLQVGA